MAEHEGKVAVVTGAGSGIGAETALHLAREGARVCAADLDPATAAATAARIATGGGEAMSFGLDVADAGANRELAEAVIERFGALHLAFLNAGVGRLNSVLDGDTEVWDRVVAINLSGVYYGMVALAPRIVAAGGGAMVATSSIAGWIGQAGMASYFATKHGVIGLVKSAASELARHGVRVNAVCPGLVKTPILGLAHDSADELLGQQYALGRVGRPNEIAEVVSFLLGERSAFVTGAAWLVDGGHVGSPGGPGSEESEAGARAMLASFSSNTKAFDRRGGPQ
ncbi:MAG: SDR family oxidoreductase [Proteobacteria bacterium]|nr:SDR family oxidoreductase [Pseudomonadota bacterium]